MIGLAWLSALERDVFTSKKSIASLDDLKGLKVRVMQSPGYIDGYRALGANPTPLAYNQLYLALQQGLVDGADTSPDQFVQDKFTEVAKHFYLTRTNYVCVVLAISKTSWNKLTPDFQRIFSEAAAQAAQFDIMEYKKKYDESLVLIKSKGIDVKELDVTPWMAATGKARDEILGRIPNGQALYNDIVAAKRTNQTKPKSTN
jgi:TRAP-type C4-dicarboxylate transport system substrate-binding protein